MSSEVASGRVRGLWASTFLRFLAVGVLNTAFGYGVYALLIVLGLQRELALLLATVLGVLFNFKTTAVLVFRSRNPRLLLRFVLVYAAMYALNAGLLELWCQGMQLGPLLAQALSLPVVVVLTFVAMKSFVFRIDLADGTAASKTH
jgi:putative flippase GtrA